MKVKQGQFFSFGLFPVGIVALCIGITVSCAQKQAEVQKLEMEMLATSMADSAASLDTTKEVKALEPTTIPDSQTAAANVTVPDSNMIASSIQRSVLENSTNATDSTQSSDQSTTTNSGTETRFDPDQVPQDTEAPKEEFVRHPGAYVGSGGYTLQIASTDSRGYAEELVSLFKDRGYQPYITELTVDGVTKYRVRIGQFTNSVEAQEALNVLQQDYGVVGWIDRIK